MFENGTFAGFFTLVLRTIPKTGQEAVVIGQQDGVTNFTATQVSTNRDEVQQILTKGSIVRQPGKRPVDNAGRDAHPANDLDR